MRIYGSCLTAAAALAMAGCATTQPMASTDSPQTAATYQYTGNPIFRDLHTADPAPLVVGDTLYLYVGHDEAAEGQMFNITEWLAFSTKDMKTWTAHGP